MLHRVAALGCAVVLSCLAGVVFEARAQQPTAAPAPPPGPPPAPPPAPPPTAAELPPTPEPTAAPPPPPGQPPRRWVLVPADDYRPAPPARRKRSSPGMMIAGIVLFGVSYVPPAFIGGLVAGVDRDVCDCRDASRMFIPVVGPLTLLHDSSEYSALNALLVFDSIAQSAGVVLTVFGIIRWSKSQDPELAKHAEPGWDWVATPVPGGAQTALRLRF